MFEQKIPPARLDRYLNDPKLKARLFVLNIVTFAFLSAPVVYAVLIATEVASGQDSSGFVTQFTWAMAVIAGLPTPAMFILGYLLLKVAESASTFASAFERGQIAIIVTLAMGEAVTIIGLILCILGAPSMVGYGFLVYGVILMGISLMVFRPKLVAIAVEKMIEEEKGAG